MIATPYRPFALFIRGLTARLRVSVPPWLHLLWLRLRRAVCLRAFLVNNLFRRRACGREKNVGRDRRASVA
jgi:hypothetical protein